MVSVLASSAVARGFKPRSGQTKDYKIGICCFSIKHTALRRKSKDWLVRNFRIMCSSGATGLSANRCFSDLAHKNPPQRVGIEQSGPHHHLIEN